MAHFFFLNFLQKGKYYKTRNNIQRSSKSEKKKKTLLNYKYGLWKNLSYQIFHSKQSN